MLMASVRMNGQIVDKDSNKPLIGVNVIMVQNDYLNGTATDSLGHYVIPNISFGKYELLPWKKRVCWSFRR